MKISEVMGIAGLTKKAINYYEEEGLLSPPVNSENNYRDYSVEDVNRLIQISILRQLDFPVKEIKEVICKPGVLIKSLEEHVKKLDNDISRLNKCRNIIDACISEIQVDTCTLTSVTKKLSILNDALKMDDRNKLGYMKKQLLRIFPGNFGRVMIMFYGSFLNEPIDTPEKKDAWLSLVNLLDKAEPIVLTDDMAAMYDDMSEEDLVKSSSGVSEYIDKMVALSDEFKEEIRNSYNVVVKKVETDEDAKERLLKVKAFKKSFNEQMNKVNFDERFDKCLRILSNDYCTYVNNMNEITKSIKFTVDDNGNIEEIK